MQRPTAGSPRNPWRRARRSRRAGLRIPPLHRPTANAPVRTDSAVIRIGVTGPPLGSDPPPRQEDSGMSEQREHLLNWLRDAHAMEQQAEQMLKSQASRIEHYPKVKARIEQHLEETRGQQRLLEGCLERLGSSPSAVKDTMGMMTALGQGIGGMFASDEIVKGAMASYVFENMEIA